MGLIGMISGMGGIRKQNDDPAKKKPNYGLVDDHEAQQQHEGAQMRPMAQAPQVNAYPPVNPADPWADDEHQRTVGQFRNMFAAPTIPNRGY
jgi:hypothetical protein